MKLLIMLTLFNYNIIYEIREVLKIVESQGNEKAIGDNGSAFGILQIRPIAIREVNWGYNTHYKHDQMFNEALSDEVFNLVMLRGVELYLKKYNCYPSEQDLVRMWNGGIYSGYRNIKTLKYYYKYLKIKQDVKENKRNQRFSWENINDSIRERIHYYCRYGQSSYFETIKYTNWKSSKSWENLPTSRVLFPMHTLWRGSGMERSQMVFIGVYDRRRNYQNIIRSVQSSCGT